MKTSTKNLTVMALLIALMIIMVIIPNIGMITLGAVSISLTHLPVIIGTIILGWKKGFILSLAFGIISLVRSYFPAAPTDFLFNNPLISVLPRLFIGFGTYGTFVVFRALFLKLSRYFEKSSEGTVKLVSFISAAAVNVVLFVLFYLAFTEILKLKNLIWAGLLANVISTVAGLAVYISLRNRLKNPDKNAVTFACAAGAITNTVFTLLAFYFFVPVFFKDFFTSSFTGMSGLVSTLMVLAGTNGVIEAIFFAVIGTPITLALMKTKKEGKTTYAVNG